LYQFKVTLNEIMPPIWRRIQVPANYSFWDLHVAIQDAMGWLDYHLHAFRIKQRNRRNLIEIGIPDDDVGDNVIPGWKANVADYLLEPGALCSYEYDFGDGWVHEVLLEGILLKEPGEKYPKCIDGQGACPPEDCGGVDGYTDLLQILGNQKHREYQETVDWLKGHAKNYYPFESDHFDPREVQFWDPKKRWKIAFGGK
jgi:Plasmid pRiA4b ORF-3-like protein